MPTDIAWSNDVPADNIKDASNFLAMYKKPKNASRIIYDLANTTPTMFKAKDILRATGLTPLPQDEPKVAEALTNMASGIPMPPVFILRGKAKKGVPPMLADGYHRTSAAYWIDPSCNVAAVIARP